MNNNRLERFEGGVSYAKKDKFDSTIAKITARYYGKHANIAMVTQVSN